MKSISYLHLAGLEKIPPKNQITPMMMTTNKRVTPAEMTICRMSSLVKPMIPKANISAAIRYQRVDMNFFMYDTPPPN